MREQRYLATHLNTVITNQGRTKRWVAQCAGFSESMLGHVINRRRTIGEQAASRIATALGVPFFMLFESTTVDELSAIQEDAA